MVVLLEAGSGGPASGILSGRFLWNNYDFTQREACQGGVAAATDTERHICGGRVEGTKIEDKSELREVKTASNHSMRY